ncbi:MAG: hypothetical protein U5K00_08095 [Melioribacteraceae bacterium]|nr:hypothetical protein [Melioribacteraceae bacterium]
MKKFYLTLLIELLLRQSFLTDLSALSNLKKETNIPMLIGI